MAETREVTLRLGAELAGGATDPLRKLADAAKLAGDEEKRYREQQKQRAADYVALAGAKERLATAGVSKEEAAEKRYQALLQKRIDSYKLAQRLKADLAKAGVGEQDNTAGAARSGLGPLGLGGLAGAMWPLAVLRAAGSLGGLAMRSMDVEQGFSGNKFKRGFGESVFGGLGMGFMNEAAYYTDQSYAGKRNIDQARFALEMAESRASAEAARESRLRAVRAEAARAGGLLTYGANSQAAQFAITRQAGAESLAAQARAAARPSYDRAAQQGDVARQYALRENLDRQAAEGQRQLGLLDTERLQAKREEAALQEKLAAHRREQEGLKRSLSVTTPDKGAEERRLMLTLAGGPLARGASLPGGPTGLDEEQKTERRLQLQRSLTETLQVERQLQEAKERTLALEQQHSEALNRLGAERVGLLNQERATLQGIIQSERNRRQGLKEQFGLATPLARNAMLSVARKVHDGGTLTRRELEFAKSHADVFGPSLGKIGDRNAGPQWNEIVRLLGLDRREKQAQQLQMKLDQVIKVQIDVSSQSVSAQLQQQVVPKIYELMGQVKSAFSTELERMFNNFRMYRRTPGS